MYSNLLHSGVAMNSLQTFMPGRSGYTPETNIEPEKEPFKEEPKFKVLRFWF